MDTDLSYEAWQLSSETAIPRSIPEPESSAAEQIKNGNLKNEVVVFDDETHSIKTESGKESVLPPFKNEHYFCRIMFDQPKNKPMDWQDIFEKMNGFDHKPQGRNAKNDEKSVKDTMYAVNNRIRKDFQANDALFSWKNRNIERNFGIDSDSNRQ